MRESSGQNARFEMKFITALELTESDKGIRMEFAKVLPPIHIGSKGICLNLPGFHQWIRNKY
jgi:hypothetical protein